MFTGQQIRDKRKAEGLSVDAMAEKLSLPAANIYKWEKGTKVSNPEHFRILENWLIGKVENVPYGTTDKLKELESKVKKQGAYISLLVDAMAEVLHASSGESVTVLRRRIEHDAEELAKLDGA